MKHLFILLLSATILQANAEPAAPVWAADATAGAAMGYCLAKHPYQTIHTGTFTPDGYEIVAPPGIVGAVRRNFVYNRTTLEVDKGAGNSCKRACAQFGKFYGPTYTGSPLRQQIADGGIINSGIGDMASLAIPDQDFYSGEKVIAGIWSRGNTWHESDVAQSDYCCCQAK
ncbi:MAG: hypothetical protein RL497_3095 [Pseudomonadota bacterium]|jgi:hypothetical protein